MLPSVRAGALFAAVCDVCDVKPLKPLRVLFFSGALRGVAVGCLLRLLCCFGRKGGDVTWAAKSYKFVNPKNMVLQLNNLDRLHQEEAGVLTKK